jgi:hypothetical protein
MEWHLSVQMKHNRRIFYCARVGNFDRIDPVFGGFQGSEKLELKLERPPLKSSAKAWQLLTATHNWRAIGI